MEDKRVRGHVARRRKAKEPKLVESPQKTVVLLKGTKASETVSALLKDFASLKHEQAKLMSRKNEMLPLEDPSPLEHLCQMHDAGLFVFGNTNKKRPDNVIMGRTFDGQVLDMVEVGITKFVSMQTQLAASGMTAAGLGSKPVIAFRGEAFAHALPGTQMDTLKSLLMDLFHGRATDELDLETLDLAILFTSDADGKGFQMRVYRMVFNKPARANGSPTVALMDHGPSVDFELRRSRLASATMAKMARRRPKLPGQGKQKNVTTDVLDGKVGRLHMTKQDTTKLVTRSRFRKALKRAAGDKDSERVPVNDGDALMSSSARKKQKLTG